MSFYKKIRNQRLRRKYGLEDYIAPNCFDRLMVILRRLDDGFTLSDDDKLWIENAGRRYCTAAVATRSNELEAEALIAEYHRSGDPLLAVAASGHFRHCGRLIDARDLLLSIPMERQTSNTVKTTVATLLGIIMCDLGCLDEALELAGIGHALIPNDPRPCVLAGAVNMERGCYSGAVDWFAKAVDHGAHAQDVDEELRTILRRADQVRRLEVPAVPSLRNPDISRWIDLCLSAGVVRKVNGVA